MENVSKVSAKKENLAPVSKTYKITFPTQLTVIPANMINMALFERKTKKYCQCSSSYDDVTQRRVVYYVFNVYFAHFGEEILR